MSNDSNTGTTAPGLECASGADKCLQPWAHVGASLTCNRCDIALHPVCAAIDAIKAPAGLVENPDSIHICHKCLLPGESPNNFGVFSTDSGRPAKKVKGGDNEAESGVPTTPGGTAADNSDSPQSMADLDWPTLLKPHSTISDLLQENKVCPPQVTKKTIWWRLYHIWNHEDFGSEVTQPLAYCNLCGKIVKISKADRSPTPLKRHLQIHHKDIFQIMNVQKQKDGPVVSPPGSSSKMHYTPKTKGRKGKKDVIRTSQLKAITQWVIETDQPLDVVEAESFRKMTATLVGNSRNFHVFTKDAIEQYMSYLVFAMRHKIKELLAGQSLIHVHEHWVASNRCSYQVERVHWIDDDFTLLNRVVACDFDKTMAQGGVAHALWESVGVAKEKQVLGTVTNRKDPGAYSGTSGPFIYQGVEFELNQIAEIALAALGPNTKDLVSKTRKIVEAVHSSARMSDSLHKAQIELTAFFAADQTPVPLVLDCLPDSWWSTGEMIGRFLYLRKALEYLTLDSRLEDIELPSKQEWDILQSLQQAWEPFSIASQLLQKQHLVTIGLVPMILQIVGEDLTVSPGTSQAKVKTCMKNMLSAWEDRFGTKFPTDPFHGLPKVVWVAHALDPRFKTLDVLESTTVSEGVIFDAVLEEMISLKMEEKDELESAVVTTEKDTEDSAEDSSTKKKQDLRALASSRLAGTKRGHNRLSSERLSPVAPKPKTLPSASDPESIKMKDECQKELDAYKAAEGMRMWIEHENGTKDLEDPLPWWKQHHEEFPTLWKVARRYFPIPATCATAERAFDAEAYSKLAKRCAAQDSSTQDMKLLKENAELVEAFEEQQEATDDGVEKSELKEEKPEEEQIVDDKMDEGVNV